KLVDGGKQRRSFTYLSDGIDCLLKIIENRGGAADGQIFNVGNPKNDLSIRALAEKLVAAVRSYPGYRSYADKTPIISTPSREYYGAGYQDILTRTPSVRRAKQKLGWEPKVSIDKALRLTLDFYLKKRQPLATASI